MALTFRSSTPEQFHLVGIDEHGRRRDAVATKRPDGRSWDMKLTHPSGRNWQASYHGRRGVLDALGELLNSQDAEFVADRARGDRPHGDRMARDTSQPVDEAGNVLGAEPAMNERDFRWRR
jgi:hypothetical protein